MPSEVLHSRLLKKNPKKHVSLVEVKACGKNQALKNRQIAYQLGVSIGSRPVLGVRLALP
jgi:hypothetical protein